MWDDDVGTARVRRRRGRRQRHVGTFRVIVDGKSSHQFVGHGCRVQAVVPVSWYRLRPRPADVHHLDDAYGQGGGGDIARIVTGRISGGGPAGGR